MVVTSEVEGLVVVTSVVLGRVSVVLVLGTVVALTVFSSLAPVLTATFVVGDFSVVITSGAVVDFFVVIAVFVIVGGVGVVTSSVRTKETDNWALYFVRSCIRLFSIKGDISLFVKKFGLSFCKKSPF